MSLVMSQLHVGTSLDHTVIPPIPVALFPAPPHTQVECSAVQTQTL